MYTAVPGSGDRRRWRNAWAGYAPLSTCGGPADASDSAYHYASNTAASPYQQVSEYWPLLRANGSPDIASPSCA